jgi:hypothetical protein
MLLSQPTCDASAWNGFLGEEDIDIDRDQTVKIVRGRKGISIEKSKDI